MRIDYAPRAVRDIEDIGAYYRAVASLPVATAIAERIERVIDQLALHPRSGARVIDRLGVRAVLVRRYPYKIFYRVRGDIVEILHIRHTARRPWRGP
jgi:plasmid stabilization system protein ParE